MARNAFIPTLGDRLEPRVVAATAFSTAVKASFTPPATFGGGQIDHSIPFLNPFYGINSPSNYAPYQGIPIGFDYTSGAFYQLMTKGYQGSPGLETVLGRFVKTGDDAVLYQQLSLLAGHIPYGLKSQGLLYSWATDLFNAGRLPAGARINGLMPDHPQPDHPISPPVQVGFRIEESLLQFLQDGIGRYFNIVKSQGSHPTDVLLTFNGKV